MQPQLPLRPPVHPCLATIRAVVAAGGLDALRRRFALGCGGGRFVVRGFGVVGRGGSWAEAAERWAEGAGEVMR